MFGVCLSPCRGRWLRVCSGRGALWVLWLAFLFVPAAWAQSETDAAVRGHLTDARGRPVSAATVRLRPADTGEVSVMAAPVSVRTDGRGGFVLLGLPPGAWEAEVSLPGSMEWTGDVPLLLEAGDVKEGELSLGEDFSLKFSVLSADKEGGGATGLEVGRGAGDGPAGKLGGTAGQATPLNELPVEDRQWEAVEEISPAAHDATLAGGGSAQHAAEEDEGATARSEGETGSAASGLSYAGLPATQNVQTVDGLSADQAFGGGPRGASGAGGRIGSSFAQGGVGSVRVMAHTFSAQYGGAAGGTVVVSSRGAGERLRGSAFLQMRQSAWAATNPFAVVTHYTNGVVSSGLERPGESTLQFGGAAGLPVRLPGVLRGWRSGVFAAVEGQERAQTLVSSPLTADFYSLTAEQTALLGNRGVGAAAIRGALSYLDGLTGTAAVRTPRVLGLGRLDAAPGHADRLSLGVQVQRGSSPVTGGRGLAEGVIDSAVSSIGRNEVQAEAYTAQWQHLFSVRASNNLRFQMAHDLQFETPPAASGTVPAIGPGGYAPQVSIQPEGFVYGTPASLGRVAYPDEDRVQAADSFALRLGRHLLMLGGDWSRVHDRILGATNAEGSFLYDSGTTGGHDGGLVDWITDYTFNVHAYPNGGCPSVYAAVHYFCFRSYAQSFTGAATEFVTHQVAGFAEDSVRVRPDLRVSVGVRYDYLLLPFPQMPNPALDAVLRTLSGPQMGVTSSFPEDRNNVGPRVSLAWSPGRRGRGRWMTLQAGYGFFYGRLPGATINAALANTGQPTATTNIRITPTVETDCPQVTGVQQGFGYPCSFLSAPTGVVGRTGSAMVFSSRFRLPAVQRGSFGVEREFGRRLSLRAEYATAWTTQLPESVDLNIAPSTETASYVLQGGDRYKGLHTGETFQVPSYTARQTTLYGPVTALVSNANATYHSGTAEVRLRDFHGWSVRGGYTYAKAIDYGPQSSPTPRQDGQFDPFANGYDKGLSSLQFAHHFTGDLSFRSEVREGPRLVRAAGSGWRFAAIGTAGSGAPYSYVIFGGTRLTGGHESINGSGGATYLPTVGRNTLRLPPRGLANLRMARELPVHGAMRLTLQADAFNLLNSVSVSRVETRAFLLGTPMATGSPIPLVFQDAATIAAEGLTTPSFGTALSSTAGLSRERQIALGARLSF